MKVTLEGTKVEQKSYVWEGKTALFRYKSNCAVLERLHHRRHSRRQLLRNNTVIQVSSYGGRWTKRIHITNWRGSANSLNADRSGAESKALTVQQTERRRRGVILYKAGVNYVVSPFIKCWSNLLKQHLLTKLCVCSCTVSRKLARLIQK